MRLIQMSLFEKFMLAGFMFGSGSILLIDLISIAHQLAIQAVKSKRKPETKLNYWDVK